MPRWAYALATIVSAVALAWGITKFFIERSDALYTGPAPAGVSSSAPAMEINNSTSGQHNAAVGVNDGTQVVNLGDNAVTNVGGGAPSAHPASRSATSQP